MGELGGDDIGMGVERLLVHADRHDDLFKRGVARALAKPVDSTLDLRGAVADALEGEGRRHAEVVMGVDGNGDVLDSVDALAQVADARTEVPRHVVAGGVWNVDHGGARLNGRLDDADQELLVGAAGVLCVELDIVHKIASVLHRMDGALDCLFLGHAELVAQMAGGHAQTRVDTRALCRAQRLCRDLDIAIDRAGEAADGAGVAGDATDLLDALEVARAGNGKARLDDVDLHAHQLAGDDEFFLGVHAGAGRLLAVAQGGIEDGDLAAHGSSWYLPTG